ncbi:lipopolysaccharide cholinephosphotransferase licD [Biomphalaria glabrata]|nr:hypothetical protein BgiMline_005303 [Biomphalaria glabrata]
MYREQLCSLSLSSLLCIFQRTRVCFVIKTCVLIFAVVLVSMFIRPLRNTLLYPVWPKPWTHVTTIDLLMMETMTKGPENVVDLPQCPTVVTPTVTEKDPRLDAILIYDKVSETRLKSEDHKHFLPVMNGKEKRSFIQMFLVLAESLQGAGVKFFFESGSLLGSQRHHGLIPWDDDIDIAIHVNDWLTVRGALSCIEGYVLKVDPIMHWKFYGNASRYPFIDMFFYTGNDEYIWAITDYTRRNLVAKKSEVFPLSYVLFEGIEMPVPKMAEFIARNFFEFDYCVSRSSNHKTGEPLDEITLLCSSLSYMYNMFHLDK